MSNWLERVDVVLCRPEGAWNVGACCRAIKTMGMESLILVNPVEFETVQVLKMALHARDVYLNALTVGSLPEALKDSALSAGITRRRGARRKWFSILPEQLAERAAACSSGRISLVFGNERSGLSDMVSWLALCCVYLIRRKGSPPEKLILNSRALLKAVALGILNPLLYYAVLFHAYELLPAQIAQPLNYTWPLFLALLAYPVIGQKPARRDIPGLIVSIAGVAVVSHFSSRTGGSSNFTGIVLALGSGLLWALYWLIGMRLKMPGSFRLLIGFSAALVPAVLIWIIRGASLPADPAGAAALIWVGLFEMGITFVFWNAAMEHSEHPARIGNLVYLGPFISLFWIALVLRESIHVQTIAGLTLIVLGILIGQGVFS